MYTHTLLRGQPKPPVFHSTRGRKQRPTSLARRARVHYRRTLRYGAGAHSRLMLITVSACVAFVLLMVKSLWI